MLKFFAPVLFPLLIVGLLFHRFDAERETAETGTRLLLPVESAVTGRDVLSAYADLRYRVLIPPNVVSERKGVVVVVKDRDGRAAFSSVYRENVPLRPREHLLEYTVARTKDDTPEIRFAAVRFRGAAIDFRPETVAYAIVGVDENGHAVLTGLADINGKTLAKTEIPPARRR